MRKSLDKIMLRLMEAQRKSIREIQVNSLVLRAFEDNYEIKMLYTKFY